MQRPLKSLQSFPLTSASSKLVPQGLIKSLSPGTRVLPLPLGSRTKPQLCHRTTEDLVHSITSKFSFFSFFPHPHTWSVQSRSRMVADGHKLRVPYFVLGFPGWKNLLPPWGTRAVGSLPGWAHAINLTAWEKAGLSLICLLLETCPLDRSAVLLQICW